VGLLCLNASKSGGTSQVVNGQAVGEELMRKYPRHFEILCQPFHFDRRGGIKPGDSITATYPIVERKNGDWLIRYFRSWIEAGHQRVNQPLTKEQIEALDLLDQTASKPEMMASFDMKPGDMFWINNRWTLHNRTEFEDYEDPEKKRHLVRLWLHR